MDESEKLGKILENFAEGWIKSVDCGPGWLNIVWLVHGAIAVVDPDAKYEQIKEKFGYLRIYTTHTHMPACKYDGNSITSCLVHELIQAAVNLSKITCEICGATGVLRQGGWIRVLCDEHAEGKPPYDENLNLWGNMLSKKTKKAHHCRREDDAESP